MNMWDPRSPILGVVLVRWYGRPYVGKGKPDLLSRKQQVSDIVLYNLNALETINRGAVTFPGTPYREATGSMASV